MTVRAAVLLVAALAALTGCTSSAANPGAGTTAARQNQTVPSLAPDTTPAASSPPASHPTTGQAKQLTAPAATATGTGAAPAARSTCTAVTVRVIRGSAYAGQEFAALQFTNAGSRTCVLIGYPTVTLLRKGTKLGTGSQPSSEANSRRTLAPNDTAESKLHDYSSCQSPLSDSIKVIVPGSTLSATRPAQLRACTLRVDPLGPPE